MRACAEADCRTRAASQEVAVATRELYERTYEGGVRAEIRVYQDRFTSTIFKPEQAPSAAVIDLESKFGRYTAAKARIDAEAGARPESDWRQVLECPVCDTRDVAIRRLEHDGGFFDEFEVTCPRCGVYAATHSAFVVLANVHEGDNDGWKSKLADLQLYLEHHGAQLEDVITADSWLWFAEKGGQLRKQIGQRKTN
jgi:hypothetical protein